MTKFVYIFGAGHCGSTLLSIMLNAQPKVFCAGEVWNLADLGVPSDEPAKTLWNKCIRYYERNGTNFAKHISESKTRFSLLTRKGNEDRARIGRDALAFLRAQAVVTSSEIIVDTSKGWRRLDLLLATRSQDVYVVHLRRDGRAIVNSYSNKYGGRYLNATRRWVISVISGWILRFRYPDSNWLSIRYEDFCESPDEELMRIFQFCLEGTNRNVVPYTADVPYLALAGNRMRRSRLISIERDERWKRSLSKPFIFLFNISLGWLNYLHGYSPWR